MRKDVCISDLLKTKNNCVLRGMYDASLCYRKGLRSRNGD